MTTTTTKDDDTQQQRERQSHTQSYAARFDSTTRGMGPLPLSRQVPWTRTSTLQVVLQAFSRALLHRPDQCAHGGLHPGIFVLQQLHHKH